MKNSIFQEYFQLFFLLTGLLFFVRGLSLLVRGAELSAFIPVSVTTVIVTWYLSKMKAGIFFGCLFLLVGLFVLWLFTSGSSLSLSRSAFEIADNQTNLLIKVHGYQNFGNPGSVISSLELIQTFFSQSKTLWLRILVWINGLISGVNISDPVIRIFAWCVLLLIISGWAGWCAGKRKIITGMLPSLIVLTFVSKYTNSDLFPLWGLCGSVICLLFLNAFGENLERWIQFRVDYAELIISNTLITASVLSILLALTGWVLPFISFNDILEQYRRHNVQENPAAKSLGLDIARETARPLPEYLNPIRSPGLPNNHLLGSGPELSQKIVFTVHTGEQVLQESGVPVNDPNRAITAVPHHYWSSYRYDVYTGAGWVSSPVVSKTEHADSILFEIPVGYTKLVQDFVVENGSEGTVYWSGMIFRSNYPYDAAWRSYPDHAISLSVDPFQGADVFGVVNERSTYQVESLITQVSEEQLRNADREFPNFIQQKYTKLPDSVPERVYSLARKITSTSSTPYDEAKALERYLRENYPYTLDVSIPPAGVDVVDHFLFNLKKGYCDYYASAMVVMARSVGLPARLVSGFSSGIFNNSTGTFTVKASDAHSWVEIYFNGIGWIEFEPTANQPEFNRSEIIQAPVISGNSPRSSLGNYFQSFSTLPDVALMVVFTIFFIIIFIFLINICETIFLLFSTPITSISYIYKSITRQTKKLYLNTYPGQTASEFAESIKTDYPKISQQIRFITNLHDEIFFSEASFQKFEIGQLIGEFRKLRWKLMWTQKKHKKLG